MVFPITKVGTSYILKKAKIPKQKTKKKVSGILEGIYAMSGNHIKGGFRGGPRGAQPPLLFGTFFRF